MNLLFVFILAVHIHSVVPGIHTVKYFDTVSSHLSNFPDYVVVGYVDDVEVFHYDSNSRKAEAKQDWMNKITEEDPDYWESHTEIGLRNEHVFKDHIEIYKKRFNQTGGVHILQKMLGCEWNDETNDVQGWEQYGYDGEDYISLDTKTWTYTAAKPQAVPTKHEWERDMARLDYTKYYHTERCLYYLKRYVEFGRDVLMRRELPEVSLLQKTPSSPVRCFATGFYPDRADLFWRKDGEELHEDVEYGEMLPNHDGTFQMSVDLRVEVTADVEGRYECVFQLSGIKEDMVTKLERKRILSNAKDEDNLTYAVAATVVLVVLAVVLLVAAIIIIKRHKNRRQL
uniref:class I histocompatibility antigen, F10 alpha chain-like n=1 Tax=Doryrhamphus excisus TaxID=161450 RepID=UPI0025AE3B08|nr:class I histocompatibility antigen, F10 alpha chain-like [Doryrhamphus excisus]XP_057939156.1 class I histocompatibility antigen, F10 alpha chain-like [Doryrhamphus excisus]XP_057939157.1 class I histocompatibility antigen, F10 alpha chain-like [Doryrhamphus excisus]XP_057939158.1 class I histocompatibility antigen, F10 alpha chain-like [Doryrhamphus excisus]